MKESSMNTTEFDEKFESGDDILEYLELDNVQTPGLQQKRVSVDFPEWMVVSLDKVARKLGVTRQSVIKVFISEKLKEESLD